jgi:putative DNA primase/helicase
MNFIEFAAAHGVLIDRLQDGRWVRVKTSDHPKKRNGAYKFLGDVGFVQNHATMERVAVWRPDGKAEHIDRAEMRRIMAQNAAEERQRQARARLQAERMIGQASFGPHPYLIAKGFPNEHGLVLDGELLIPMRDFSQYKTINSLQRISADGEKKFLPGGKAKGSVYFIGPPVTMEKWYCEGYANGLTIRYALGKLYRTATVVVCFSAGNLEFVAKQIGRGYVYADNDASGTGQKAAEATGLPWVMSDTVGSDANDDFLTHGIGYVCQKLRGALARRAA